MSATDMGPGASPVLVVDVKDIRHEMRDYLAHDLEWFHAYTSDYTWDKTDISNVPAGAVVASRIVVNAGVHSLCGWCITETTGAAAAQFRLLDGSAVGNEVLASGKLAQGTTTSFTPSDHGIKCYTGRIFLQVVSGSLEGVIYWR
jgi:hypothetical protein